MLKVTFSEMIQASIRPAKSSWLHQVAKDLLDPNVDCERGELSLFTVPILKHAIFIPYFSWKYLPRFSPKALLIP